MGHIFTEDCQQLLKQSPQCSGWLRTKNGIQKLGDVIGKTVFSDVSIKFVKLFPWTKHFVILSDNIIYIFKHETSKTPEKRFRLNNFKRAEAIVMDVKEIPWPLRLTKKNGGEEIFGAMSEDEQQKWLKSFETYLDNSSDDSDYEEPNSDNINNSSRYNRDLSRGPLPEIPKDSQEYEDPEDNNNNLFTHNNKSNNGNLKHSKRKGSDGSFTSSENPTNIRKAAPPPPPSAQGVPSRKDIFTKKAAPIPPKPTVKILPQPKIPEEVYATGDQLPYELDANLNDCKTLTEKAMWNGLPTEATRIMTKLQQYEGTFLLRDASNEPGYTLHVACSNSSKKFKVKKEPNGKYSLGTITGFNTVEELLIHFKDNSLPTNDVRLGKPYTEFH